VLGQIEAELAQGRPVTLIGETGPPRWYRPVEIRPASIKATPPREPFRVSSGPPGMIELLPRVEPDTYTIDAEVRHEFNLNGMGRVGVYAGYRVDPDRDDRREEYFTLEIADRLGGTASRGQALAPAWVYHQDLQRPDGKVIPFTHPAGQGKPYPLPSAVGGVYPWHQLHVEVKPGRPVRVLWDGAELAIKSDSELRSEVSLAPIRIPSCYDSHGGIGIYVNLGEASYRNVVIRPSP
jgi:serine/threonine-protein kinase